jgi:transposase
LTTKLHVRVVGNGLPVQLELSPGQANDAPMAELLLNDLPRGAVVLADRAYDADWIREVIEDQKCKACIPPKANRSRGRAPGGGVAAGSKAASERARKGAL